MISIRRRERAGNGVMRSACVCGYKGEAVSLWDAPGVD